MLEAPLRSASVVLSLVVLASFALFAIDETRAASQQSRDEIVGQRAASRSDPSPDQERAREQAHGTVRELVDDADDVLVAPFAGLADGSESAWARRGVPAAVALLVYGFGLGFLARFSRGRA